MSNLPCSFEACLLQYTYLDFPLKLFFAVDLNKEVWLSSTILILYLFFLCCAPTPHYLLHNTCLEFELKEEERNGNKKREMEEQREIKGAEGMRGLQKKGGKKTLAMPIILKELRTGPRTRISKMGNAGIHHAVGMWCWLINYYYDPILCVTILSAFYHSYVFIHLMNWLFELHGDASPRESPQVCAYTELLYRKYIPIPSALSLLLPAYVNLWRLSEAWRPRADDHAPKMSCTIIWFEQPIGSTGDDSGKIKAQCDLYRELGRSRISGRHFILHLTIIAGLIISVIRAFVHAFITHRKPDLWVQPVSFGQLKTLHSENL